jgi:hypothetical protein
MTRCLDEKTLFLLSEGYGGKDQRLHLEGCQSCAQRYDRIAADLDFISNTLQKAPPSIRLAPLRMPILYRSLPIAVALLLGIALVWGESRLWSPLSPSSTESAFNRDLSQFLDQVSDALFSNANGRDTPESSPDLDVASVQAALGQDCSSECRELFASLAQERSR